MHRKHPLNRVHHAFPTKQNVTKQSGSPDSPTALQEASYSFSRKQETKCFPGSVQITFHTEDGALLMVRCPAGP